MSAWFSVLALLAAFLTRNTQAQVQKNAPALTAPISEPYLNESWGERDGLPGGPVQALWESNDGLLWVGSQYGLRIFDGKTFRIPEELADLKDESIEDIFTDGSGLLWMQGRKAIFSIQLRSDGVYEKSRFEGSNLAKDGLGWVWFKTGSEIRGRRGTMEASFPSEPASKSKSVGLKVCIGWMIRALFGVEPRKAGRKFPDRLPLESGCIGAGCLRTASSGFGFLS
jgi:hypothetical protein